jgi:hypothetical protein
MWRKDEHRPQPKDLFRTRTILLTFDNDMFGSQRREDAG